MKWEEAIIQVLAEEGIPMSSVEITKKIIDKGYRDTKRNERPEQTVAGILSKNKNGWFEHIFEDGKCKGNYKLVETYESASHSYTASDKTVDREAPVVVRPCTSYDPSDPKYKRASDFITSTVPSPMERELLELIVNFPLPLAEGVVCFADILDKLEVKFSDEDKKPDQTIIDKALLEKKLEELKKQIADMVAKAEHNPNLRNEYERKMGLMRSAAEEAEQRLREASDEKIEFNIPILGEFVSVNEESKPKVVIYLKSIENNLKSFESRGAVMAGVFVHEMFHAWNYFIAGGRTSVLAIDEPMVEFATLYFLKELEAFTKAQKHSLKNNVLTVRLNRASRVEDKQQKIGDLAAYGFGYYLFENLSDDDSKKWIETYSKKSASINGSDSDELVKEVEYTLIPIYPFKSEAMVMEWFREIIFNRQTTYVTTGKSAVTKAGSHVSLRDLVLACIETIGRKCFDAQELYAFAPIFKVCVPECKDLKNALKQQLDELVKEGHLDALRGDCYGMK